MIVPNENKVPFREMTKEERSAIVEAKIRGEVDFLNDNGAWARSISQAVGFDEVYRTKPRRLIIPWDVIKHEFKWAAMDSCLAIHTFCEKPDELHNRWICSAGYAVGSVSALNIDTTGIDWRESLVQRPEGV